MSVNLSEYMSKKPAGQGPEGEGPWFGERGSKTWDRMWDRLFSIAERKNLGLPHIQTCPNTGETWQYMGSDPEFAGKAGWYDVHVFRHRNHPKTRKREVIRIRMWR